MMMRLVAWNYIVVAPEKTSMGTKLCRGEDKQHIESSCSLDDGVDVAAVGASSWHDTDKDRGTGT